MKSDIKVLPLNEVLVGMVVSKDLFDTRGGLILRQGAVVTETILLSLQRRGMEVLGIAPETGTDFDLEAGMECQRQRLLKLFRRCDDSPADTLLLQYVTQYRLERRYE